MKKVLVVEDDFDAFQSMFKALSTAAAAAGIDVNIHHAACGQEMLACMSQQQFHLISLDGQFPESLGGVIGKQAGLTILRGLQDMGHTGHTFFYSGRDDQVEIASKMSVAGKVVHSLTKNGLDHLEWAKACVLLLKD